MKAIKTCLLACALGFAALQVSAQSLVDVLTGATTPTAQGWQELRFDNSVPWEQETKDLLVAPSELQVLTGAALKLKANDATLYSQLGYYKANTGFNVSKGYTVEFKAKVVNAAPGAFTVYGISAGKGFRLELSNSLLAEHSNVLDVTRPLSVESATDAFHTYRVAVAPDEKIHVWRDGLLLGELPMQTFKTDNIMFDGGFENGEDAAAHGWIWMDDVKTGTLSITSDPAQVHTGNKALFVDKGFFKNQFIPVKPGATYDISVWGKKVYFPTTGDGHWRDFCGWHDPAADRTAYFVTDRNSDAWQYWQDLGRQGGGSYSRFIVETPTGDLNDNQWLYDDIHYTERIEPSRIPGNAVNLFPNPSFEDPDYDYFPQGDPRNDTSIVNPNNFHDFLQYYADWDETQKNNALYDWDETPFWHPFFGARVRVQAARQGGNDGESGNNWARTGQNSLRIFNCFSNTVPYGTDFRAQRSQGRNTPLDIKLDLEVGKTYSFSFYYHFAKWGGDHLKLWVRNGTDSLWYKDVTNSDFPQWKNGLVTFTTTAANHTLRIQTQNTNEKSGYDTWGDPGVLYFDDFFLWEGTPLPVYDNTYLFFGKPTSKKGAEVDIEYIKTDNTGAYRPDGTIISSPYVKKTAPLMTTWGEQLDPTQPILNEYPRPQLKRAGWQNLNGIWEFARKDLTDFGTYNATEAYRQQILVPYAVESALSGIMESDYTTVTKTYSYKRTVQIVKPTDDKRVILHFGAIDWESYVFVNGTEVAHHKGGFDPFYADITATLNASGTQEIVVQSFDPTIGGQPHGKQNMRPTGDQYSPVSGIWQTVWTETVAPAHVTNLDLTSVNNNAVKVKVDVANADGATATVSILDGTNPVATQAVTIGQEATIAISSPKLWSPETPFLYNVKVEVKKAGTTVDEVTSYVGLRKIEVKMLRNKPFIYVNDKECFNFASLDHGYYPDGLYTPASYDVIRYDMSKLKELGFNTIRKFQKIEPAVYYHIADSLGFLVWQDIPAAKVPENNSATSIATLNTDALRQANFLRETEAMTKAVRNFTSIVVWFAFNDGWGQYNQTHSKNTVNLLRSLNDSRLIAPESGTNNYELGDLVSSHGINLPNAHNNVYNERASVCGVTAAYGYYIDRHVWNEASSSGIKNADALATSINNFNAAAAAVTLSGVSGFGFVQTTDVENEINGLLTYDRKVNKYALPDSLGNDSVAGKMLRKGIAFMKTKIAKPILYTSAQGGEQWKYIAGTKELEEETGWSYDNNFDDSAWLDGVSGFGSNMDWFKPNTAWTGDNRGLYMRKKVTIPVLPAGDTLKFSMAYDEDFEFYINGVMAFTASGYTTSYVTVDIYPDAKDAINYGGENLFAIHVIQNGGGSAMDLGLTAASLNDPIDCETCTRPQPVQDFVLIRTATEFDAIRNNLGGWYKLANDVNLSGIEVWIPIGEDSAPFKGVLDGNGNKLILPTVTGGSNTGLFSYADGAVFKNLQLEDGEVIGGANVGILLGRGTGISFEHIVFRRGTYNSNLASGRDHVGIVAGMLNAGKLNTIKNVYVENGTVESSEWQAAGLVGIACDTRIENSYFTGSVEITRGAARLDIDNADAGGIISRTEGGHNQLVGVMSLADSILSGSGNQFAAYNGGGQLDIFENCFTRDDMQLDPLKSPNRGGQFARATAAQQRPLSEFKSAALYIAAGWDIGTVENGNVWMIPEGGGFPVFTGVISAVKENVLPTNLSAYSINSNIVLTVTQPTKVWLYNLQGALILRADVIEQQSFTLPRGIYVVKAIAENGKTEAIKVLNR